MNYLEKWKQECKEKGIKLKFEEFVKCKHCDSRGFKIFKQTGGSQLLKVANCNVHFEISMGRTPRAKGKYKICIRSKGFTVPMHQQQVLHLAKANGFTNAQEMREHYEKFYDLSEPKHFEVVGWEN